ncbi:CPBP family intramembrane glutamic endopeptidase [Microbacterium schleiferi]|uniref:CPBP family intramembrane glutamic endopeptidase n=1 Tax=Microbacterium schleiferi TaxID=69362 RepID=UPI001E2EDB5B|nr:type II CAAX endopeptidase family protein [Microbacterium schleiferi]
MNIIREDGHPSAGPTERVRWAPVVTFVLLACGLAWLTVLPAWISGEGLRHPLIGVMLIGMMFTPTLSMVVTMLVWRAPATERLRFLGMWPLRPARRVILMLLIGLVAPIIVVTVTVAISGALGLVQLDVVGLSGYQAALAASVPAGTALPPVGILLAAQLVSIPIGAIANSVSAAGEELGWRGWLLPSLRPLGTWPALLITGAVWGLWHSPVILLGYNFNRPDLVGVALMVGGCVAWGILFGWLRLRSGSVWPAVLAHGSLNAVGGLVFLLIAAGAVPDMGIVGPLGIVSWVVLAVVAVILAVTGQFRRQPPLAPARPTVPAPTP